MDRRSKTGRISFFAYLFYTHIASRASVAILAAILQLPAFFSSCTQEEKTTSVHTKAQIYIQWSEIPTPEALDLFFFFTEEPMRLDAYQKVTGLDREMFTYALSGSGPRRLVALSGMTGDIYSWADIQTYGSLGKLRFSLEEEDPGRLENDIGSLKKPFRLEGEFLGRNFPDPASLDRMAAQIAAAKAECDILIAYFHKGYVHQVARLGEYETLLSHMAVDNGADTVIGTHSHILHGLEMYKGRAIYHGLNNFIMYTPQLSPLYKGQVKDTATSHNAEWVKKRVERFGFVPDPEYPTYPFHPDSVHCACAKLIIREGKIAEYRLVPMLVEKDGAPCVHGCDEKGRATADYLRRITAEAGLNARLRWAGDELVVE